MKLQSYMEWVKVYNFVKKCYSGSTLEKEKQCNLCLKEFHHFFFLSYSLLEISTSLTCQQDISTII